MVPVAILGLIFLHGAAEAKLKGFAFSNGRNSALYTTAAADASLDLMRDTGANMVHVIAYGYQESVTTSSMRYATNLDNIRRLVRKCKARGMQVFFKPVIEMRGRRWRGLIPGTDEWFASYRGFIRTMARLAQEESVELFAAGSEYRGSEARVDQWKQVFETVRAVYGGDVTYVTNHDSYQGAQFLDDVDVISLSAYQPLLTDNDTTSPSYAETRRLWEREAGIVGAWLAQRYPSKQLFVAEVGAQSKGQGLAFRRPWDWETPGELNLDDQENYYQGFLSAFLTKEWCVGVNIWNWEVDPTAGSPGSPQETWYTPQNKPALETAKAWFNYVDVR